MTGPALVRVESSHFEEKTAEDVRAMAGTRWGNGPAARVGE